MAAMVRRTNQTVMAGPAADRIRLPAALAWAAALLLGCSPSLVGNPAPPDAAASDFTLKGDQAIPAEDRHAPDAPASCKPGPHLVGQASPKPAWATAQFQARQIYAGFVDAYYKKFTHAATGQFKVGSFTWSSWDDVMEGGARLERYLALAGTEAQRKLYVRSYIAMHEEALKRGYFHSKHHFYVNLFDAEHIVEGLMYHWTALDLAPDNPKLKQWIIAQADWLMSSAPYDASAKLFRAHALGTSTGHNGEQADILLNLAYTYPVLRAWMLTNKEAYRRWVSDYTGRWAGLTLKGGAFAGVLPFQVSTQTFKPGPLSGGAWYKGGGGGAADKFDYETYGWLIIGRFTSGATYAQRLARGGATLSGALQSTLWKFVKGLAPGPPADSYNPSKGGWNRLNPFLLPRQFVAMHTVRMDQASRKLLDAYITTRIPC